MSKILIIIPTYNEKKEIVLDLIEKLNEEGFFDICIVDDGSRIPLNIYYKDVTVLRHCINRGKGAAIKTAMTYAIRKKYDIIVTIDGDGQHDPRDIGALIEEIKNGYDIVLGTRLENDSKMPLYKRIANHVGNMVTWVFFGVYVADSQSGMRAYTMRSIEKMDIKSDGYAFDSEVVREIGRLNLKYKEVPINVKYTEYSMNKENKQTILGGIKTMINFFRIK